MKGRKVGMVRYGGRSDLGEREKQMEGEINERRNKER